MFAIQPAEAPHRFLDSYPPLTIGGTREPWKEYFQRVDVTDEKDQAALRAVYECKNPGDGMRFIELNMPPRLADATSARSNDVWEDYFRLHGVNDPVSRRNIMEAYRQQNRLLEL